MEDRRQEQNGLTSTKTLHSTVYGGIHVHICMRPHLHLFG